jgi:branched-chain amino acid transport system permease protein
VLARGEIIAAGSPAEIEAHPQVLTEYLGVKAPEAEQLLQAGGLTEGSQHE